MFVVGGGSPFYLFPLKTATKDRKPDLFLLDIALPQSANYLVSRVVVALRVYQNGSYPHIAD